MSLYDELVASGLDLQNLTPGEIAAAISSGRIKLVSTPIGIGTILDVLGPTAGATFLDTLEGLKASNPTIKWAWTLIDRGVLDIGIPSVRQQVDGLALAGILTAQQAFDLKSLAEVPNPVSALEVAQAIERK